MMFDWGEFKQLADSLVSGEEPSECQCRNAISRYYYHALHCFMNFLETFKSYQRKDEPRAASKFIDEMNRSPVWHREGRDLLRLKRLREQCDYFDDVEIGVLLVEAREIHSRLNIKHGRSGVRIPKS